MVNSPLPKPSLAECLAEALDSKAGHLPGTTIPAVWLNKRWVSLPHLSYGTWPPHKVKDEGIPQVKRPFSWHWRGLGKETQPSYKTASWLHLGEGYHPAAALRKKIEKAAEHQYVVLRGGLELLAPFWIVYAKHLHQLGSLPLPQRFFESLLKGFEEGFAEVFLLEHQGKIVGGAINLMVNGFYENAWFATTPQAQRRHASYWLHYQMIQRAMHLQADIYSFGRSTTGSGVHQFKRQWKTKDVPLLWIENGEVKRGGYLFKPLGKLLKVLPFRWVVFLGDSMFKYIY